MGCSCRQGTTAAGSRLPATRGRTGTPAQRTGKDPGRRSGLDTFPHLGFFRFAIIFTGLGFRCRATGRAEKDAGEGSSPPRPHLGAVTGGTLFICMSGLPLGWPACAQAIRHDRGDAVGGLLGVLVFPYDYQFPPCFKQETLGLLVSGPIARELLRPPGRVRLGRSTVLRASVPEAASYLDRRARGGEHKVDCPSHGRQRA